MMRSMFAAISGLKVHQTMLDVTSNDIANVNTLGFKGQRTTFKDSLAQLQRGGAAPTAAQGGSNAAQVGLGVQLGSIDNQMGAGALQTTGNVLDVAIQGEGMFRVAGTAAGANMQYTRAGNFTRNANGATNVAIGQDGSVSYDPAGGGARVTAGYMTLAKFPNESGLERTSSNRWKVSASSGAETIGSPGGNFGLTTSGTVEMSNVDLASEFTNMITAQRGFQANSRVISTSDELLQDLVNLKR